MRNRLPAALASLSLCVVLAACSARTDVSLTGNTPAQYSHVWITTQEVWVNTQRGGRTRRWRLGEVPPVDPDDRRPGAGNRR